jgi:hypothetical protein
MTEIPSHDTGIVRGESVIILETDVVHPVPGTLGATTPGATTKVRYSDGEVGYVKPDDVRAPIRYVGDDMPDDD